MSISLPTEYCHRLYKASESRAGLGVLVSWTFMPTRCAKRAMQIVRFIFMERITTYGDTRENRLTVSNVKQFHSFTTSKHTLFNMTSSNLAARTITESSIFNDSFQQLKTNVTRSNIKRALSLCK